MQDNLSTFDYDDMLARCVGKVELVQRALARFEEGFNSDLESLSNAVQANDAIEIARVAHRIKGASANVSAMRLCEEAAEMENLAVKNELTQMPILVERIFEESLVFRACLSTHDLKS